MEPPNDNAPAAAAAAAPPAPSPNDNAPPPLSPTLTDLIVTSYEGKRNATGCYEDQEGAFATFAGGHTYQGQFKGGMMHGKGKYTWAGGTTYEGDFQFNTIHGQGQFVWEDRSTYTGAVAKGLRHGQGSFKAANGYTEYVGEWVQGERHGQGTLWYDASRRCCYQGAWEHNKRHGQGTMQWQPGISSGAMSLPVRPRKNSSAGQQHRQEGNLYDGGWLNDEKNGWGRMVWFDKKEQYEGEWKDNKQNGKGEHVWRAERQDSHLLGTQKQLCNRYIGDWKDGLRNGDGVFFYANGAKYEGAWQDNKKHGLGVFTFEDGHVYEGPFEEDRMVEDDPKAAVASDDPMQPQLCLRIDDLLPTASSSQAAAAAGSAVAAAVHMSQTLGMGSTTAGQASASSLHRLRVSLEKAVLRHTSELKLIYKRYSTTDTLGSLAQGPISPKKKGPQLTFERTQQSQAARDGMFAMTMAQFARLWSDCGLASLNVSLATVHRIFAAMRIQHEMEVSAARARRLAGHSLERPPAPAPAPQPTHSPHTTSTAQPGVKPSRRQQNATASQASGSIARQHSIVSQSPQRQPAHSSNGSVASASVALPPPALGGSESAPVLVVTCGVADDTDNFSAERPVLFREFCEGLARIACFAYMNDSPRLSPTDAFERLMYEAISPNHSPQRTEDDFVMKMQSAGTQQVLSEHDAPLRAAFAAFAREDGTMSLRSFLLFMTTAGSPSEPPQGLGLGVGQLLEMLVVGDADGSPLASDPTLLEADILWSEFLEALAHIALATKPAADDAEAASETEQKEEDKPKPTEPAKKNKKERVPMKKRGQIPNSEQLRGVDELSEMPAEAPVPKHTLADHLRALLSKLDLQAASAPPPPKPTPMRPPRRSFVSALS